jgi:hypothetical protein
VGRPIRVVYDADTLAPAIDPHVRAIIGARLCDGRATGKHCTATLMHEKPERAEPSWSHHVPTQAPGKVLMEYRRQVAMRRDGDDFVVALQPDDVIVFATGMPTLCGKSAARFVGRLSAIRPWHPIG